MALIMAQKRSSFIAMSTPRTLSRTVPKTVVSSICSKIYLTNTHLKVRQRTMAGGLMPVDHRTRHDGDSKTSYRMIMPSH